MAKQHGNKDREKEKEVVDRRLRENSVSASLQVQKALLKEKLDNIEFKQKDIRKRKT